MNLSSLFSLLAVVAIAVPQTSWANREEPISGPNGGQPYRIVYKDDSTESTREPGLYTRNGTDWMRVFDGEVLIDPKRGPVIQLLSLAKTDDRSPGLTVINGQIRLFSVLSDAGNPRTLQTLDKAIELGSGATREIPAVLAADHLSIFQADQTMLRMGGQLILISIKSPAPAAIAQTSGMTIAVRLKKTDGPELIVDGPAYIVDNQFRSITELGGMIRREVSGDLHVYSELLQQSFMNRLNVGDYREWQPLVGFFVQKQLGCMASNDGFCKAPQLASYDADTGKAAYSDVLKVNSTLGAFAFHMVWPLNTGAPFSLVSSPGNDQSVTLPGRLRIFPDGSIWGAHNRAQSSNPTVFAVENDLYFVNTIGTQKFWVTKFLTVKDGVLPEKFSIASKVKSANGRGTLYVVVSTLYRHRDTEHTKTTLYVLPITGDKESLRIERMANINASFYEQDELTQRLILDEEIKKIGFDSLTPIQGDASKYEQARQNTTPYLDLEELTHGTPPKFIFTNPKLQFKLTSRIEYKEFERSAEVTENPSGIYLEGEPARNVFGTLIPRSEAGEDAEIEDPEYYEILRQASAIRMDKLGSVSAKAWAVDPTHRQGDRGFHLALALQIAKERHTQTQLQVLAKLNIPFSDLREMRLVGGKLERGNTLYAILFFHEHATAFVPIRVSDNGMTVEPLVQIGTGKDTPLGADEFVSRLVHDQQKGDLYLIQTPGISPNSREFQVYNFNTRETIYPKREHAGQALTFDMSTSLLDQYQAISDESSMSWKVKPFADEGRRDNKANDLAQAELFASFRKVLEEAANPNEPPRRRIVIVPDEIRDLAIDFVNESYMVKTQKDAPEGSLFHRFNRSLSLYRFDPAKSSADEIFENFEIIQSRKNERGVVLVDLEELIEIDRPASKSRNPFVLKIPTIGHDEAAVSYENLTPHVLYLLATGTPLSYEEFREKTPPVLASTLLVGTAEEYALLKDQADEEMTAGLDKAFEVIELPEPTLDSKTAMLTKVVERPDIRGLKFTFDASEIVDGQLTPEEQQRKLFDYAVTRIDALARPRGENSFSAFIEFLGEFTGRMVTDPIARSTRRIDRSFVERILKDQFNLALNLADLPENHPLKILSREDAVFLMQRAGMLGELELKAEVIRLSMAQLKHDPSRNLPSSWIWAGEPGTGKSKAWDALAKMLNLKRWNRSDSSDKRAQANEFFLDTVRVRKGDPEAVNQVINDLNDFVASPKGSTGYIFIDDLSFADDNLGRALVQWVRGIQQAEKGVYRIQREEEPPISVSVQNLTIGIAMNFTDNKTLLEQFQSDGVSPLVSKIIATGNRFGIDKSFVNRVGGVYNFDSFHESVKEPSLNQALLDAAKKEMGRTGKYVVVDPILVRQAAKAFPKLGARGFLSKTTEAIISQPDQMQMGKSKVFAIVPKTAQEVSESESSHKSRSTGSWGEETAEVKEWVGHHARVIELEQGMAAPLMLMRLMVPSFRSPILESFVYSLQMDARFKDDRLARGFFQAPALFATFDHLVRAETIPLKDLKIEDSDFNLRSAGEKEELHQLIEELSFGESPFVIPFPSSGGRMSLWPELGIGGERVIHSESRKDVLIKFSKKIEVAIQRHLLKVLNVTELGQFKDVEGWLRTMPEHIPNSTDALGQELTDLLLAFMKDFQSQDLYEASNGGEPLDPYVSTRFFLMALDQAIAKLPWADLGQKMATALQLISQDRVLGQSVGVQNWLFNSDDRSSLLKPTTTNLIREMVEFNSMVRDTPNEDRERLKTRFDSQCESFLIGKKR